MAKVDSRSFTPPHGWPFVVLPAKQAEPKPQAPQKPQRRRLADNVVALFHDERPPVVNPKRRGRFPRGVVSFRRWERIRVGDYCLIWASPTSPRVNHGRMVQVVYRVDALQDTWLVQAVEGLLTTFDSDSPDDVSMHRCVSAATVSGERLRRCPRPLHP